VPDLVLNLLAYPSVRLPTLALILLRTAFLSLRPPPILVALPTSRQTVHAVERMTMHAADVTLFGRIASLDTVHRRRHEHRNAACVKSGGVLLLVSPPAEDGCGALRYSPCGSALSAVSGCRVLCLGRAGGWFTALRRAGSARTGAAAGGRRGRREPDGGAGNADRTERLAGSCPGFWDGPGGCSAVSCCSA
jgi:hypothetical protein